MWGESRSPHGTYKAVGSEVTGAARQGAVSATISGSVKASASHRVATEESQSGVGNC